MSVGGLLFAVLVVIAAYTLGRIHGQQIKHEREVDLSALLDSCGWMPGGNGDVPCPSGRQKDRPASFTTEDA